MSSLPDGVPVRKYARDILARVKISQVYKSLTGIEPRRTGLDTCRGPAVWRGGDGRNVSMDDSRGIWHDFRDDTGGGVLDLIVQVRGGSRADALRWLADFASIPLDESPLSTEERARWARERAHLEGTLPTAQYWQRAAVSLTEGLLETLKSALWIPSVDTIQPGEIADVSHLLLSLQRMDGAALVTEYQWWSETYPGMTAAMVSAARSFEHAERRALMRYLALISAPRGGTS